MKLSQTLTVGLGIALVASAGLAGPHSQDVKKRKIGADKRSAEKTDDVKPAERTYKAELGKPAPDFVLNDLAGRTVKLSDLRGKTVVLEWFNPECPVVQAAHGQDGSLRDLGNRASKEGVVWLAVNSGAPGNQGHGKEKNQRGADAFGIEYPILMDESGYVGRMYGASTTPHMFVIDSKGTLLYDGAHDNSNVRDAERESYVANMLADVKEGGARPRSTKPFGCGVKYAGKADVGLAAPDFELADLAGNKVKLSDFRGKVTVLEWFNPECPIVQAAHGEGGALESAANRWSAQGVAWLAVNSGAPGNQGHGVDKNQRAKKSWNLRHPILVDEEGKVGKTFGAATTPHMFIIDQRGVLVYAGGHDDRAGTNYVDQALTELLAGKPLTNVKTRNYGCGVKY